MSSERMFFTLQNVVITDTVQIVIKRVVSVWMIFHVTMSTVVVLEDVLLGLRAWIAIQVRHFYHSPIKGTQTVEL